MHIVFVCVFRLFAGVMRAPISWPVKWWTGSRAGRALRRPCSTWSLTRRGCRRPWRATRTSWAWSSKPSSHHSCRYCDRGAFRPDGSVSEPTPHPPPCVSSRRSSWWRRSWAPCSRWSGTGSSVWGSWPTCRWGRCNWWRRGPRATWPRSAASRRSSPPNMVRPFDLSAWPLAGRHWIWVQTLTLMSSMPKFSSAVFSNSNQRLNPLCQLPTSEMSFSPLCFLLAPLCRRHVYSVLEIKPFVMSHRAQVPSIQCHREVRQLANLLQDCLDPCGTFLSLIWSDFDFSIYFKCEGQKRKKIISKTIWT